MRPLTEDEQQLQRERGAHFREMMTEITADFSRGVERPAIFLSGGVDSSITLWGMLEAGLKPIVITYQIPGAEMSKDARRALRMAEHHGLESHVYVQTTDPDHVAREIERLVRDFPRLKARADLEVLFLFGEMLRFAATLGCDSVFTGICDGTIHLLTRKWEVRARAGGTTVEECDGWRVIMLDDNQFEPLVTMARDAGIALCAPVTLAVHQLPYQGVSWEVMNTPTKKAITRSAYLRELEESKTVAKAAIEVQPMQCGDSGSRDYFDTMLSTSTYARELAGRALTSGNAYYNSLLSVIRGVGGPREKKRNEWPMFRRNVSGMPFPDKRDEKGRLEWEPYYSYTEDGRAVPPASEADEDDLFGSLMDDQYELDDSGNPDTRVDCWGTPFYEGDDKAMTGCLRAQRGLCGSYRPEVPYKFEACESFQAWYPEAIDEMSKTASLVPLPAVGEVYEKWTERARTRLEEMSADYADILD